MNQSQGGSEVLEGKYLAQIKKCRNATVQLEVERSRSKQLETQLEVAQADLEKRKGKPAPAGQRRGGSSSARSASSDGHPEDSFKPEEVIRTLKERLDRTYQQLQEKTMQIEESKRDQHRLVQLVCKEVGRPKEEVEQYLRSDGESQPTKMNESAAGGLGQGWKGRAANIVLLKGRIKDLEKEVALHKASASDMASKLEIMKDGDVSLGVGDDSESLARLIRHREKTALLSQLDGQSTQARSVDINGAPSKLDVDDQSRQHVAAMESKRLGSLRDVEGALAQVTKQLQDEKLKQTALQARFNTLQQDNQQLRSYVETILRKSSTDDELLSAYKDEVRELRVAQKRLQVELQEVRMEAELNDGNDGAVEDRAIHVERHTVSKGETGSEDEYRRQIDDLTRRLEVAQEALGTAPQLDATPTPLETQLVRWVQEGLRRFCSNENTSEASASGEPVAKNVAAFVHAAHEHVLRMEVLRQCGADRKTHDVLDRYDQLLGTVHELLSSAGPQQNAKTLAEVYRQLASLPPLNQALVKSNKKLDERIQGLTEMMERDALVHRALLLQQEQEKQRAASSDRIGAEGKRAAETSNEDYKALQKKYNDLRMAFNGLQHQRMTAQ